MAGQQRGEDQRRHHRAETLSDDEARRVERSVPDKISGELRAMATAGLAKDSVTAGLKRAPASGPKIRVSSARMAPLGPMMPTMAAFPQAPHGIAADAAAANCSNRGLAP
ncbi:MAG: hypothetical protein RH942_12595 [Kiloniellaceae bacterium]